MIQIKVLFFGRTVPFACCTHTAAIISDLESTQNLLLNYPFQAKGSVIYSKDEIDQSLYGKAGNSCCLQAVTLYSSKSFDEIKKMIDNDFQLQKQFHWSRNNCANKVYNVLDFIFDLKNEYIAHTYKCYQWLCCSGWLASCGILACLFPAPPCIKTPRDDFALARWLSLKYGEPNEEMQLKINQRERSQSSQADLTVRKIDDPVVQAHELIGRFGCR